MNPVLLVVTAALAACLYLVGLALDMFWLKLLTKPWLVVALAVAVGNHAGDHAGRRIAWGLLAGAAFSIILTYWAGQTLFAATAIRRQTQTAKST